MTLQEILRAKDDCNGCTVQNKHGYTQTCLGCIGGLGRNREKDNYKLDESLKAIEEKAAKFDMIQWAIDTKLVFMGIMLVDSDIEYLKQLYREREQNENS